MTKRITVCGVEAPGQKEVRGCILQPGHKAFYHVALVRRVGDGIAELRLMWWAQSGMDEVKVSDQIDLDAPGETVGYETV